MAGAAAEEKPYSPSWGLLAERDWAQLVSSEGSSITDSVRTFILRCGDFAASAYDAFISDPNHPKMGRSYYGPGNLLAKTFVPFADDYVVTKLLHALPEGPIWARIRDSARAPRALPWTKEPPFIGYVAVATRAHATKQTVGHREIVVVWRGTSTLNEWFNNIALSELFPVNPQETDPEAKVHPVNPQETDPEAKVMHAWYNLYMSDPVEISTTSVRDQLRSHIQQLVNQFVQAGEKKVSITCVGHSLGGALAILSAFDIVQQGHSQDFPVRAVVFACPKIGNQAFLDSINQYGPKLKILSVKNKGDLVTKVPRREGYINDTAHAVLEVDFDKSNQLYNPILRNVVERHDLQGLLHTVAGWNGKNNEFKSKGEVEEIRSLALVNKYRNMLVQKEGDEDNIPASWGQVPNKGMAMDPNGKWKLEEHVPANLDLV